MTSQDIDIWTVQTSSLTSESRSVPSEGQGYYHLFAIDLSSSERETVFKNITDLNYSLIYDTCMNVVHIQKTFCTHVIYTNMYIL